MQKLPVRDFFITSFHCTVLGKLLHIVRMYTYVHTYIRTYVYTSICMYLTFCYSMCVLHVCIHFCYYYISTVEPVYCSHHCGKIFWLL